MVRMLVDIILSFIEGVLGLRFLFKLLGSSDGNGLVNLIDRLSAPLVAPFSGLVHSVSIGSGVLEYTTLIAIVVYGLIGLLVLRLTTPHVYRTGL
jgi:hypothetical protein